MTAARTGEVIGARWREIDLVEKIWTIPSDRMKAGKEHRVPLSARALTILDEMGPHAKSVTVRTTPRPLYFPEASTAARSATWRS